MSVNITKTFISRSKAKYSAAVKAILGVAIRSIAGSFARLINITVLSIAPVFLKSFIKKSASSNVIPIAAKTIAKFSLLFKTVDCLAICAASSLCGNPLAEKIGSFCPLTNVFSPSIADIPVCMNSWGYVLAIGLIVVASISRLFFADISGILSIGFPNPLNVLPIISSETFNLMLCPKNLTLLCFGLIPKPASKSCTKAFFSSISKTLQSLFSPLCNIISPISSKQTFSTSSTSIKGPATSFIVLYSLLDIKIHTSS